MSVVSIEHAMEHLYADQADQAQVERKLSAAIESAEQYIGRRIYATADELSAARVSAAAKLPEVVQVAIEPMLDEYTTQMMREVNEEAKYELTMQLRGIVVNDALETGILLILGDLYANRENTTDKAANELPMGAKFHLQPFRRMLGV